VAGAGAGGPTEGAGAAVGAAAAVPEPSAPVVNRSPLPLPPTLVSGTPKQSEKLLLHHVLGD